MSKDIFHILAVDDHPIVLEGILTILNQQESLTCSGISDISKLPSLLNRSRFDMYLLDLEYPQCDGIALIQQIRKVDPKGRILIYSMHDEPWVLAKLCNLNINGFVVKNAPTRQLVAAIDSIRNGQDFFTPDIYEFIHKKDTLHIPHNGNIFDLSEREIEVLKYLAQGYSTEKIAEKLFLSKNTIQTYRKRLMIKLQAKNVAEAIMKGKDWL